MGTPLLKRMPLTSQRDHICYPPLGLEAVNPKRKWHFARHAYDKKSWSFAFRIKALDDPQLGRFTDYSGGFVITLPDCFVSQQYSDKISSRAFFFLRGFLDWFYLYPPLSSEPT
jgi:hypothetical protein